jgi:hypothetical protein
MAADIRILCLRTRSLSLSQFVPKLLAENGGGEVEQVCVRGVPF